VTQQVLKARYIIELANVQIPNPTVDFVFEATGSDTSLDFSDSTSNPLIVLNNFWSSLGPGQTHQLSNYMSSEAVRSYGNTVEWYDITAHLDGSPAGSPVRIDTPGWSGIIMGSTDLHPALCGVAAYRRAYGTAQEVVGHTRPRARDRGRIHIGPLRDVAMASGTGQAAPAFQLDLLGAMSGLAGTHNFGLHNQFNWVQWSRMNASVGNISQIATQYGLGVDRRRVDESNSRVLGWEPLET
jgi:hypothetical protein